MDRSESYSIDHTKLLPGLYVSRKDYLPTRTGEDVVVTTFDIRMCAPNREPVMNSAAIHTIEHIGAALLRGHPMIGKDVLYFGPMGCRTGFNLLMCGDYSSSDILNEIEWMFKRISNWRDSIPGDTPEDCGNWQDVNLGMAKYYSNKYLYDLTKNVKDRLEYPE